MSINGSGWNYIPQQTPQYGGYGMGAWGDPYHFGGGPTNALNAYYNVMNLGVSSYTEGMLLAQQSLMKQALGGMDFSAYMGGMDLSQYMNGTQLPGFGQNWVAQWVYSSHQQYVVNYNDPVSINARVDQVVAQDESLLAPTAPPRHRQERSQVAMQLVEELKQVEFDAPEEKRTVIETKLSTILKPIAVKEVSLLTRISSSTRLTDKLEANLVELRPDSEEATTLNTRIRDILLTKNNLIEEHRRLADSLEISKTER